MPTAWTHNFESVKEKAQKRNITIKCNTERHNAKNEEIKKKLTMKAFKNE